MRQGGRCDAARPSPLGPAGLLHTGEQRAAVIQAWWNHGTDYFFFFSQIRRRVSEIRFRWKEEKKSTDHFAVYPRDFVLRVCWQRGFPSMQWCMKGKLYHTDKQVKQCKYPLSGQIPDMDLIWISWFKLTARPEDAAEKSKSFIDLGLRVSGAQKRKVKKAIKCLLSCLPRTRSQVAAETSKVDFVFLRNPFLYVLLPDSPL